VAVPEKFLIEGRGANILYINFFKSEGIAAEFV